MAKKGNAYNMRLNPQKDIKFIKFRNLIKNANSNVSEYLSLAIEIAYSEMGPLNIANVSNDELNEESGVLLNYYLSDKANNIVNIICEKFELKRNEVIKYAIDKMVSYDDNESLMDIYDIKNFILDKRNIFINKQEEAPETKEIKMMPGNSTTIENKKEENIIKASASTNSSDELMDNLFGEGFSLNLND